jgi:hypothetical protein
MAHQERDAGGSPWGREPSVTPADRGMWQRQAAAMLEHLVHQHADLPAINWHLTWVGNLRGHVGTEAEPGEARKIYTAWATALGLDACKELPGAGGLVRAHGREHWGSVSVSLTASVLPAGSGEAVPDAAVDHRRPGLPATRTVIPAVKFLARTLRLHQDIDAVTWLVCPSGELKAEVSVPGSPLQAGALFRRWREALYPGGHQATIFHDGARTGAHAGGLCPDNVRVTLEATIVRTPSHHETIKPANPVDPGQLPGTGDVAGRLRQRLSAAAERCAARRPVLHPPVGSSEQGGPTSGLS